MYKFWWPLLTQGLLEKWTEHSMKLDATFFCCCCSCCNIHISHFSLLWNIITRAQGRTCYCNSQRRHLDCGQINSTGDPRISWFQNSWSPLFRDSVFASNSWIPRHFGILTKKKKIFFFFKFSEIFFTYFCFLFKIHTCIMN